MINFLLAEEGGVNGGNIVMWVLLGVLAVALIAMMIWSSKRRKKQEEEAQNLIDAVKPGNKVKTIGGICGIVVEVDSEENTFVLETGTELSGKCFIKFDRQAIYQTDAVVEKTEEKTEEKSEDKPEEASNEVAEVKEVKEEANEEVKTEAVAQASEQKEQPEEVKKEAPAKKSKKKN